MNTIEKNKNLVELIGRKGNINESLYTWKDMVKLLSGGWVPLEHNLITDWNWSIHASSRVHRKIGYQVDINSGYFQISLQRSKWCIWDDAHEVRFVRLVKVMPVRF
jgi:hypothetical protein